jgi:hypothetical protein
MHDPYLIFFGWVELAGSVRLHFFLVPPTGHVAFQRAEVPAARQAMGTGTEEWGGGGDYWGGRNMTTPLAGHPVGREAERKSASTSDRRPWSSAMSK